MRLSRGNYLEIAEGRGRSPLVENLVFLQVFDNFVWHVPTSTSSRLFLVTDLVAAAFIATGKVNSIKTKKVSDRLAAGFRPICNSVQLCDKSATCACCDQV